jgi:hypothetical protein
LKNKYGSFDELDIKAKVMLTIWELTKNDGRKFASPEEIAACLDVEPGYIRTVISEIEHLPGPHLSEKKYHSPGKKKGRKRISYRLHDDAVIKEGTALILTELLKNHRNHSINRDEFVSLMVKRHGMTTRGVNNRISEGIRMEYIEDMTEFDGTIRGREQINVDFDYIKALASKYRSNSLKRSTKQALKKA